MRTWPVQISKYNNVALIHLSSASGQPPLSAIISAALYSFFKDTTTTTMVEDMNKSQTTLTLKLPPAASARHPELPLSISAMYGWLHCGGSSAESGIGDGDGIDTRPSWRGGREPLLVTPCSLWWFAWEMPPHPHTPKAATRRYTTSWRKGFVLVIIYVVSPMRIENWEIFLAFFLCRFV